MADNPVRDEIYEALARIGQAVSHPNRLHLISLLSDGEKSVEDLAAETGMTSAATSAHLKVLKGARLVEGRRDGRRVRYRLSGDEVTRFWVHLRELGEGLLPEVREVVRGLVEDPDRVAPLDGPTLLERVRRGELTVLDVRPPDEYEAGHVPGARSIPLSELEARLGEIPTGRDVVAYCRGPYCVMARSASELLRRHGLPVRRLLAGMAEWRAAGLPTES